MAAVSPKSESITYIYHWKPLCIFAHGAQQPTDRAAANLLKHASRSILTGRVRVELMSRAIRPIYASESDR